MFLIKDSKSPFYQIVYFVNGKRTKISTRKTTKSEAIKVLKDFEASFEVLPETKKIISLSKYQKEYIEYSKQSKSKSYLKSINLSFRQLIQVTGDIPLQTISTRILDQFIISVYSRSKGAAGLYYRTLKAAFSKAVVWEYISENPFKKIKAPKQVKSLPIFIKKEEFQKILNNTKYNFLKDLFITAFYTGMRLGELLNMQWSWIDLNQNLITVKNSSNFTTKTKKERIIPIHLKVKEVILNHYSAKDNSVYIFTNYYGIKLKEDFVSKQFKKAVRKAGLSEDIHFHSLRHSFASNLVQSGASLYVVKELLGHQDFKTTQIYSHLQKGNLLSAVNSL
ncbi:MAG: tyrosine-type recombinase/integrase [Ignavibacteria bacterium]|jgi:site-specific recombinase XerD